MNMDVSRVTFQCKDVLEFDHRNFKEMNNLHQVSLQFLPKDFR